MSFARTDQSLLGRWWWTVDRWQLVAIALLRGLGAISMLAASPAAADRIGLADPFQLARRHIVMIPLSVAVMLAVSLLSPRAVRRGSAGTTGSRRGRRCCARPGSPACACRR